MVAKNRVQKAAAFENIDHVIFIICERTLNV